MCYVKKQKSVSFAELESKVEADREARAEMIQDIKEAVRHGDMRKEVGDVLVKGLTKSGEGSAKEAIELQDTVKLTRKESAIVNGHMENGVRVGGVLNLIQATIDLRGELTSNIARANSTYTEQIRANNSRSNPDAPAELQQQTATRTDLIGKFYAPIGDRDLLEANIQKALQNPSTEAGIKSSIMGTSITPKAAAPAAVEHHSTSTTPKPVQQPHR